MKLVLSIIFLINSSIFSAQETQIPIKEKQEKIKIGNYAYQLYLKPEYNYEMNFDFYNYYINLNGTEQRLGTALSYRKKNSSKNYNQKIDETHPPDSRANFKDGIILQEGNIEINYEDKTILVIETTFDENIDENAKTIRWKYQQQSDGFFKLVE